MVKPLFEIVLFRTCLKTFIYSLLKVALFKKTCTFIRKYWPCKGKMKDKVPFSWIPPPLPSKSYCCPNMNRNSSSFWKMCVRGNTGERKKRRRRRFDERTLGTWWKLYKFDKAWSEKKSAVFDQMTSRTPCFRICTEKLMVF